MVVAAEIETVMEVVEMVWKDVVGVEKVIIMVELVEVQVTVEVNLLLVEWQRRWEWWVVEMIVMAVMALVEMEMAVVVNDVGREGEDAEVVTMVVVAVGWKWGWGKVVMVVVEEVEMGV